jgi:predicted enzyme related to lactoylglutathione lyase
VREARPARAAKRLTVVIPGGPQMSTHGHFHWNELVTSDVESAKRFYAETIGWSFEGMPMPQGGLYWVA